MSKPRTPGQTLIGVAVDEKLLAMIDARRGGMSRSAYVRMAIGNYLGISGSILQAPDRTGKGGRPKKVVSDAPIQDISSIAAEEVTLYGKSNK